MKCNHSFLLLEQLKDIVIASLFAKHKLCEATVKILDLLTAITCTKTKNKKNKKTKHTITSVNPAYSASNITLRPHIFVQTSVYDEDKCEILSDVIGGKNVACCRLIHSQSTSLISNADVSTG